MPPTPCSCHGRVRSTIGKQAHLAVEAEICAGMKRDAYLLDHATAAIVPEQPLCAIPEHVRLIDRLAVPACVGGSEDGICGQSSPARDAVARAGQADVGVILVAEADVRHVVPLALEQD